VGSNDNDAKLGPKGSCGGHVAQFWNFGTRLISRERLNLETSYLARKRKSVSYNEKKAKLGQKGYVGSRDLLLEFRDPRKARERLKLETSNFARRRTAVSDNEICNTRSKGVM